MSRLPISNSHVLAALLALATAACGGGDDGPTPGADVGPSDVESDSETDTADAGCEGEETCACYDDGTCEGDLLCEADVCVTPETECTPGETNCECLGDGTCLDASDECVADACVPRSECDGELGCPCDAGACEDGLDCVDSVCTAENAVILELSGGDARACDILVDSADFMAVDVIHPAGFRGQFRARGERTAIALIRTEDTAIAGPAAAIVYNGDVAASDIGAVSAVCYDRLGSLDGGVTPTIQ